MLQQILPTDLKQRLDRGDAVVNLDVREPDEVALARLPGAVHIPMGDIPARLHELDPDREIVVVCHHGVRSAEVTAWLIRSGWEHVRSMSGGVDAYTAQVDPSIGKY